MAVKDVPRELLDGYLRLARLPVTIAEGAASRVGADQFVPTIAFDALTGTLRERIGTALGDAELAEEGRRVKIAADERSRALRLRVEAERVEAKADDQFADRRRQVSKAETRVQEEAERRRARIETEHEREEQAVAQQHASRKAAVRKTAAAQEKRIARKERDERLEQLDIETEALTEEEKALTAKSESLRLQDAATKVKAARKSQK